MAQPILYPIPAFDSALVNTINFMWSGNQAKANKVTIRNNATNAIIYEATQVTYQPRHILPVNSLTNGIAYNIRIQVIDILDVTSAFSPSVIFYCFTTPTFNFSNIVQNQIIANSSFQANLNYSQSQGEPLNQYQIFLYDYGRNEIYSSGVKYKNATLTSPISNLVDNNFYFVRATGITLNGMLVDTGYISVSVEYLVPSFYSYLLLENNKNGGYIKIQSNIISIEGKSDPNPPTYINSQQVDLRNSNAYVNFDEGFSVQKDFTFQAIILDSTDYSQIIELGNGDNKVTLKWMRGSFNGDSEKAYVVLKAYNSITNYVLHSNLINIPLSTDQIQVWVRRVNNMYELKIFNISGESVSISAFATEDYDIGNVGYMFEDSVLLANCYLHY